jgi:hypothetical protein
MKSGGKFYFSLDVYFYGAVIVYIEPGSTTSRAIRVRNRGVACAGGSNVRARAYITAMGEHARKINS